MGLDRQLQEVIILSFPTSSAPACPAELCQEESQAASSWVWTLVSLGLAEVVTTLLLRTSAASMVAIWSGSNTYSYGFVVLPICALLVWRRRHELKALQPSISFAGIVLAAGFAAVWILGNVADVQLVQQFAFIGLVESLIWAFLGTQLVHLLIFPLAFLFFAVPAGESLVVPLQRITAIFTVNAVRLCGIPAVQDGFVFSTPSGDWKIAEACSGIRYLTSSFVVGVLVAGVAFRSWRRRVSFVLISVLVPILANAARAFLIVFLANYTSVRIASGVDHIIYGWIFFSLVTAILIAMALRWREPELQPTRAPDTAGISQPAHKSNARLIWCTAAAIAIVLSTAGISDALWSRAPVAAPEGELWSAPADWLETFASESAWVPNFKTVESNTYQKGSRQVSAFVGFDTRKGRGVELVNSANAVGSLGHWDILTSGYRETQIAGQQVTVAEYLMGSVDGRRLVWTWYLSGNEMTAKPYEIKWMQAKSRLSGHPGNVFIFAIMTGAASNPTDAIGTLTEFARGIHIANHQP